MRFQFHSDVIREHHDPPEVEFAYSDFRPLGLMEPYEDNDLVFDLRYGYSIVNNDNRWMVVEARELEWDHKKIHTPDQYERAATPFYRLGCWPNPAMTWIYRRKNGVPVQIEPIFDITTHETYFWEYKNRRLDIPRNAFHSEPLPLP